MPVSTRYILWDHDGVLVDTERWYFAATQQALGDIGVTIDQALFLDYMQENISCWDLAKEAGYSDADIIEHKQRRNVIYQQLLATKLIEIPGVAEVLLQLSATHRMAIVTTAKRTDFDLIHRNRNLIDPIEFVLSVEDYPNPKPHPDPYQAALDRFGAQPEQAIAIEDTSRGMRSAIAAGLRCIIIRHPFTAAQDFSGAWAMVDSIREIPAILTD
jgi:HAD superfamily hydrolase (TIGR01509 family)